MTKVFHVVGEQGSGKSILILMLADGYAARGLKCAGQDPEPAFSSTAQARAAHPSADVLFVEHLPDDGFTPQPGDTIIRLESVPRLGGE